jgi:glycosyltransferase involved in cell wall biosynthesis
MNILMMTNTYTPLVGGLERSIKAFAQAYRARGHRTLIVAPVFEGMPKREADVIRIPAIQHFNGSDFSVKLPLPPQLGRALVDFRPEIVHAHHPFLIGNTALRLAHTYKVPLVFTQHTLFEQYTHYLPVDSPVTERFVIELSTGYANLCDVVFAPSQSVAELLAERGVVSRIAVVPTGVDITRYAAEARQLKRTDLGVPEGAFVLGHVGRLAQEKNLQFLAEAVVVLLKRQPRAWLLMVGDGPLKAGLQERLAREGVGERVRMPGVLRGQRLIDAYHAMDAFAFSSKSETQGLVLLEAMAAGVPPVALDGPGVRDVLEDRVNGRLLATEDVEAFIRALEWLVLLPSAKRQELKRAARATAEAFSTDRCAERALALYASVALQAFVARETDDSSWALALRRIRAEWDVLKTMTKAAGAALTGARARS